MHTFFEILKAILMGIVEGITEWLPISSTGHMILLEQVVKFNASEEFMSMFRVVIQLGAILAVVVLFWGKLWPFGMQHGRLISKPAVWSLWFKVIVATLPVLAVSPLDDWMEERFYNYITVAAMLILYGLLFFVVENRRSAAHISRLDQITLRDALIIGIWQTLAIIPGTSRSGATIVGGLLLGMSRACVAEFTFYLAIPVMAGASLLKVLKFAASGVAITATEIAVLAVGCVVAFGVSMAAIRFLMDYVKRHDFKFFGAYRIVLGIIVLAVAAFSAIS
ncbi:MAG: undecaprenyl-diphosphate phosphatase [Faecalibacterium sp.]